MAWHNIKTAPKDRPIIVRCPGDRLAIAIWDDMPFVGTGWFVRVPLMGGWGHGTDTFIRGEEDQPTHWMVLPSKP